MTFWRDESLAGRGRRAVVAMLAGVWLFGALAAVQFVTGLRTAAIALAVSAGCLAMAGCWLLILMRKVPDAARPPVSADSSRYRTTSDVQTTTVNALRRTRIWHLATGATAVAVALTVAANATIASGAQRRSTHW
jgi:hypothetical protein